jgi:hypothetical protein
MKKLTVIYTMMATFFIMGCFAYYQDESGDTDTAFAIARWLLIPFIIMIEAGFGLIKKLYQFIKTKLK